MDSKGAAQNGSDSKFEESEVKVVNPKIAFPTCRHILVAMGFFAFLNLYSLRVNLSVAIVAMIDNDYIKSLDAQSVNMSVNVNETAVHGEAVCAVTGGDNETQQETESGPFKWDTKKQGVVLASFFYGYATTQIIGGTLSQRIGGKLILLGGIFVTSLLSLLTPVLTIYGDYPALIAIRVLEGIAEGVAYPSMHAMLSKWAPPMERSKMATTIYAGAMMGTVFAMALSGILCKVLGWESVFYVFGVLGVIWSVMWMFLIYNSPAVHPRITKEERDYIESNIGQKASPGKGSLHVPWCSVATSLRVYAFAVAHVCNNFGYYTLMSCLPMYLKYILHFDIKSNGFISGAPYLVMWFMITSSGLVADKLRTKKIISTTNVRKCCNGLGFMFPAVLLICTGYVECNAALAVALIVIAVGLSGIAFAGWSVNHLDLAPPYAGTLMGITNTLATIPGFVGPSIVGAITYKNQTRAAWRTVFFITAGIYAFGTIFYGLFGSGDLQPWAATPKTEEMEELKAIDGENSKKEKEKAKNAVDQ